MSSSAIQTRQVKFLKESEFNYYFIHYLFKRSKERSSPNRKARSSSRSKTKLAKKSSSRGRVYTKVRLLIIKIILFKAFFFNRKNSFQNQQLSRRNLSE